QYERWVRETRLMLEKAIGVLNESSATDEELLQRFKEIYKNYHLVEGTQFFRQRMGQIFDDVIKRGVLDQDFPKRPKEILSASSEDLLMRLSASGLESRDLLKQDLTKSMGISQANLEVFRNYFAKSIRNSVWDLERAARRAGEPMLSYE